MLYKDILHDLEFYPQMRERKNKNRYLAAKLEKRYNTGLSINVLVGMVVDTLSWDRGWRHVLQHNKKLRGSDYDEKKVLEQKKVLKLGYEAPGNDLKEFKDLIDNF